MNVERINSEKAEREIAEDAGVEYGDVIVDIPSFSTAEFDIPVLIDTEFVPIEDLSPLVNALKQAHAFNWRLGVYCPSEHIEKVRKVSIDYFNINVSKKKRLTELFEL